MNSKSVRISQPRMPRLKARHPLVEKLVLAQVFSSARSIDAVSGKETVIGSGTPKFTGGKTLGASAFGFRDFGSGGTTDRLDTAYVGDSVVRSWHARVWGSGWVNTQSRIIDSGVNFGGIGSAGGTDNSIVVARQYTGGLASFATAFGSAPESRWSDIVVTWDSSGTAWPSLYQDGEFMPLRQLTAISGTFTPATLIHNIGNRSDNARGFRGLIECVHMWDRILSPDEIRLISSNPYVMYAPVGYRTEFASTGVSVVSFSGPVPTQNGTQGSPFSSSVAGYFSGTLTPFTYTLQAGTLPAGLSLAPDGTISGTPTTPGTSTGIVIRATDTGTNTADTNSFSIVINAAGGSSKQLLKITQLF